MRPEARGISHGLKHRENLLQLTALRAAICSKWNLPRPKKHATGMFFASLCSAGLFDSVGIVKKRRHPKGVFFFW
jgi:hypothetical protein